MMEGKLRWAGLGFILGGLVAGLIIYTMADMKVHHEPSIQPGDDDYYSLITNTDHVQDYNLTLDDCLKLMQTHSDVGCYLQPEGEI